ACGPSSLGMTRWAIAADAGEELAAIAAQVTTADFRAPFYPGGSFSLETALSWLSSVGGQERPLGALRGALAQRGRRPLLNHLPLRDLDRLATGRAVPYWHDSPPPPPPPKGVWRGRRPPRARGAGRGAGSGVDPGADMF